MDVVSVVQCITIRLQREIEYVMTVVNNIRDIADIRVISVNDNL